MQAFTLKNSQMTPGLHIVVFNWYNAVSLIEVFIRNPKLFVNKAYSMGFWQNFV